MNTQRKPNDHDCSIFAIGLATAILHGDNPRTLHWDLSCTQACLTWHHCHRLAPISIQHCLPWLCGHTGNSAGPVVLVLSRGRGWWVSARTVLSGTTAIVKGTHSSRRSGSTQSAIAEGMCRRKR